MREFQVTRPKSYEHKGKRVGRGHGSGRGTTSGKGQKGQKSRRGVTIRPGFEGGQLPLIKRLPHQRGFTNPFRVEYQVVNLTALDQFESGAIVTPVELQQAGLIRSAKKPVKILGTGKIEKALMVQATKFSATAKKAIEARKGTAEEIDAAATV